MAPLSDQLPTRVWVCSGERAASGFVLFPPRCARGAECAAAIALLFLPFGRLTVAWCILVLLRCVHLINVVPMECPFPITERLLLVTFFVLTCVSPDVSVAPLDVRGLEQRRPPSPESFFALGAEAGLPTAAEGWVLAPDPLRTLPCLWAGEAVRVHLG